MWAVGVHSDSMRILKIMGISANMSSLVNERDSEASLGQLTCDDHA